MDRRTFMKLLGGFASLPIVGRVAKPLKSETVQEGIAAVSDKGMELYEMVISKVMKEGTKVKESGRVDSYKHPDRPDITVDVNQTDGSAEIYFDTDQGSKGFAEIKRDPETGGDELTEAEEVYKFFGKDGEDYVKDIEEGISGGITNLEEFTRIKKATGGVASAVDFAKALDQVGAGTAAQKRQNLSNYLGDLIATQGQKLGTAAVIPLQAAKGVLGIQGTPITGSMQASLQNIIQDKISKTGKLKGGIDYRDYGVQTTTGKEFEGFGKRSITDPEAALATTLGQADYVVDPKTGKVTFTGGTAYDFRDDQFGGLGKFISKGGVFGDQATQYNPDITLGPDFMKQSQTSGGSLIRGFTSKQRSDGKFEYTGPDGQVYGPDTYADIAAGKYPKIYNPDKEKFRSGIYAANQVDPKTNLYDIDKMYANYTKNFAASGGKGYFSSPDMLSRFKQFYADGGSVDLTIITMPDISGSGVESLFKTR
mgnify:FL=1